MQRFEVRKVLACIASTERWPTTLPFIVKKRIEEEYATFFETHELMPDGSIFPAPVDLTRASKENRKLIISTW